MMNVLSKILMITNVISILFSNQMNAYCSRCVKIEEKREEEQRAHPQSLGYYDDQIGLNDVEDSADATDSNPTKESSKSKSEALKKSSNPSDAKTSSHFPQKANEKLLALASNSKEGFSDANQNTPIDKNFYSTLYTIFKTKNFLETLDGSFTLFIPIDEAFQQLPRGTLSDLVKPQNAEKLAALVSNHIVARQILRKDFIKKNNFEIKAISGKNLTLSYKNGDLYVDDIRILGIQHAGYDGVIYIIDKVLLP